MATIDFGQNRIIIDLRMLLLSPKKRKLLMLNDDFILIKEAFPLF